MTRDGQIVGTVTIKREGLYCRIFCRCRAGDETIHRLYAGDEKIGVLIPQDGYLLLDTKVAAKRLKPGCQFTLDQELMYFIPIRPGEPFAHLDKLRKGRLVCRQGVAGLMMGDGTDIRKI